MKMKTVKSCLSAVIALAAALVSTVASAWPTAKLGLPAGYTRLDSITSTGTQYINTGVSASQGTVMDFSFRSGLISARDVMYFGSDKANTQYRFTFQPRAYNDLWYIVLNRQVASGLVEDADYRLVVDYLLANRVTLTHGDVEQAFTQLDSCSGVIYLFSGRDPADGSSVGKSAYTFYEMKLWEHVKVSNKWTEDMTAQRDFVPARRDSDGAIGLCDAVNGLFYPNEGTGEFIAGPVTSLGEFTVGGLAAETFNGSAIPEPKPVVTDSSSGARLTEGQDYTLSYLNNHGAGTATAVVTGIGAYAGTVEKTDFLIVCASFADDWLATADTTCQKYVDDDARIYVFTNVESAVTATMCSDCMLEQVLLVGGGGAGGSYKGGGGGAGGVVYYPTFVQALATGTELSMSVGAGGPAPATATVNSSNGSASTLTIGGQSWSALGGGAGGRQGSKNGLAGASGGGAAYGSGTGGAELTARVLPAVHRPVVTTVHLRAAAAQVMSVHLRRAPPRSAMAVLVWKSRLPAVPSSTAAAVARVARAITRTWGMTVRTTAVWAGLAAADAAASQTTACPERTALAAAVVAVASTITELRSWADAAETARSSCASCARAWRLPTSRGRVPTRDWPWSRR